MTECDECGYSDVRLKGSPCPLPRCDGVMKAPGDYDA